MIPLTGFDIHAEQHQFGHEVALWFYRRRADQKVDVIRELQLIVATHEVNTAQVTEGASLTIEKHAAERLLTALWKLGIRPIGEDLEPQVGELDAIRAHLKDLQRLLFRLDVEPRT